MLEKFRVDYNEQNFEHLDLDFGLGLNMYLGLDFGLDLNIHIGLGFGLGLNKGNKTSKRHSSNYYFNLK